MKDRLSELRALQQDLPPEYEETKLDMEEPQKEFMDDFFKKTNDIQKNIRSIQENVQELKKKHSAILSAPQPEERVKEEMEQLMAEIQQNANRIKILKKSITLHSESLSLHFECKCISRQEYQVLVLKNKQREVKLQALDLPVCKAEMEKSIKHQESANMRNFADIRIKKCQHSALLTKFVGAMTEYNNIQNDYRDHCKNRIKRQLHIAGRTVEDDELEEMIKSRNPTIFMQGIIIETQQAKQSLQEIEAEHNDIVKLENSIKELHEMFTDMALLVQSQGEMIDSIEYNVHHAAELVRKGGDDICSAFSYKSKARRKKFIIVVCCLVLLLIIGLALYFSLWMRLRI
ncbi:syntaxin-1A-like [Hydra vulgaris]|uniref:Syntaxin-1A-like n=1 Tax=Hydra vulgaris TaxID=6087 RepID=A0ABM4CRQ5_HYDVU